MAPTVPSYTQKIHNTSYNKIDPTSENLRTNGKVILITGASGGIGSATALAFAKSQPKAIILLGRNNSNGLNATADAIKSIHTDLEVQTHLVDLCDSEKVLEVFRFVVTEFGSIDILVHAAGFLPQPALLIDTKPETFLDGYKTTVVGTLTVAQAFVKANQRTAERSITFINLTSAAIFFPADPKLGAYVSSKIAAFKLLECFALQNKCVRLHQVHPGYFETEMSKKLELDVKLGYEKDDISLASDFLVWIASPEAEFLTGKFVFGCWDVEELKKRQEKIAGDGGPVSGELFFGLHGFPRYVGGNAVFGA